MTGSSTAVPFEDLLAAARRRPELAAQLGIRALAERREEDAISVIACAAEARPPQATLWQLLGLLHRALGDLAPAVTALDRAVALAPHDPRLVHARARAALEAGLPSLEWFARARTLAPADGDVILGEAAALLAEASATEADQLLDTMVSQHPGWLPGHDALIRLRHTARHPQPLAAIDAAIAGAPRDVRLHRSKVLALHRARMAAQALAAVEHARQLLPGDRDVDALAAIVISEHGSTEAAEAAFARVDPLGDLGVAIHWWRHLLRRGQARRLVAETQTLPAALRDHVWPYLSAAWRLTGDPRAQWLDDSRLIRTFQIEEDPDWLAQLASTLRALHVAPGEPIDQSVRGGTQTDGPLFSRVDPVIQQLRARIRAAVDRYLAELPADEPTHPLLGRKPRPPRFAGSWSVRLTDGGHHDAHVHTEGRVSSAFYVALPPAEGKAGWLALGEPQESLRTRLPPLRMVEPKPGMLVLFPSTLWHGTRPFAAGERLTVAFDIA